MHKAIESNFINITGCKQPVWNERLISKTSKRNHTTGNEISKEYVEKFKRAVEAGEISLEPVESCCCGSKNLELLSSFDRFGLDFSTVICRDCGIVRTAPFIAQTSLKKYYESYYHPIHFGKVSLHDSTALFKKGQGLKVYERVKSSLENSKIKVLEIGVGTGSVLLEFKETAGSDGRTVEELGTELNEECIKKAKENGINVIYGGIEEVIDLGRKYDLVILSHVFEHFIDLNAELAKLKQVIAENGLVYVEVPGLMTLHKKSEYQFDYLAYVTHAHVYNFNLASLTTVFNLGGFELVKGNEEVEALFRRGLQTVDSTGNSERIRDYLMFLEQNREYFCISHRTTLDKAAECRNKDAQLKQKEIQLIQSNDRVRQRDEQLRQRDEQLRQKDDRLKQKDGELRQKKEQLSLQEEYLKSVFNSRSWKITKPLRWGTKMYRTVFEGSVWKKQEMTSVKEPISASIDPMFDLTAHRRRMQKFKDRYKGKRCFIIGNGPSLNKIDLRKLKNEYTFGVNGIFYKCDEMGFKPTFYVVEDNHVVADNIDRINNINYSHKFFPHRYHNLLKIDRKTVLFKMGWEFYWPSSPHYCNPRFSLDCSDIIYAGQTVTYVNMQLAYYMGFKEVYLIGMDFSYRVPKSSDIEGATIISNEDDPNHFHPDYFGKGKKWHDPKLENCLLSFQHAKMIFEGNGRKIFNATVGGKLELFDRVNFDEMFRK